MRIRIFTIIFATLLLSIIPFQKASAGLIPVYRFSCYWWIWTTNYDYGNAYCQGQNYDGIAFYAWDNGQTGTEQVYRLFNINDTGDFVMDLDAAKKPFYNLMMFPYPSAEGMHVGNMYAFTGADVYGRFQRMQGRDVFEPIGLDGFGRNYFSIVAVFLY